MQLAILVWMDSDFSMLYLYLYVYCLCSTLHVLLLYITYVTCTCHLLHDRQWSRILSASWAAIRMTNIHPTKAQRIDWWWSGEMKCSTMVGSWFEVILQTSWWKEIRFITHPLVLRSIARRPATSCCGTISGAKDHNQACHSEIPHSCRQNSSEVQVSVD